MSERLRASVTDRRAGPQLAPELLRQKYLAEGRSVIDIARSVGCSRESVYYYLSKYGIPRRGASEARSLALAKGRVRGHHASQPDPDFFRQWTAEMAYVLGVIATDGCLAAPITKATNGRGRGASVTIVQRDPELLEKTRALIGSTAPIRKRARRVSESTVAGEVFLLRLGGRALYEQLLSLGLTPRKSRTFRFLDIPAPLLRHFIRGCWDGDGSFYATTNGRQLVASFVSGSKSFMEGMVDRLGAAGIAVTKVYVDRRRPERLNYQIKLSGATAVRLGQFLYDGVPAAVRLERKFSKYERFAGKSPKSPEEVRLEPMEAVRTQPFHAHGGQLALFVKDTS